MLLCADAGAASADLASGVLACPSCGTGRLRYWGYGRERVIRVPGGTRRLRPRRGRCRSCAATHVLLPSWALPRRADSAGVIAPGGRRVGTARHWHRAARRRSHLMMWHARNGARRS